MIPDYVMCVTQDYILAWIQSWNRLPSFLPLCRYPNNPVLKVLTPQGTCRKLDIFPVKMTQEAISVDVSGVSDSSFVPQGKGGADSSIDLNNVFAEEQRPYYEGQNPESKLFDALLSFLPCSHCGLLIMVKTSCLVTNPAFRICHIELIFHSCRQLY